VGMSAVVGKPQHLRLVVAVAAVVVVVVVAE
jgi:hypothetical protein